MTETRFSLTGILPVLFLVAVNFAMAQNTDPCDPRVLHLSNGWASCEEARGQAAEKAGKWQEALRHYTNALQKKVYPARSCGYNPKRFPDDFDQEDREDQSFREKIIDLARKINPPPAIPKEAERHLALGTSIAKKAKTTGEIGQAREEFEQAVKLAPWWADASYNLGMAQVILGLHGEAIRNFKLYLLAAPNAPDAGDVRAKIFKLEMESEQK